ncbi:CBS domain-containing protein [Methanococcoides vulcani]|uniref:CBS domain-containing protein n=1 Tax=Methanococcoides vulcani TaxID=1353158 RepID=A0A1I0BAL5_9EURY|nr:CBS domain-containing protein [Methanococcoides vulcani]SET03960.1 CBS domain-containing protein [Methanococcoides vulcani]
MPKDTLVKDVMVKDVASVALPGSRDEVLSILKDKRVSGLPVIKDNKVVGIVSRSNLLKNPTEEQLALLMARDPVTIGPDEDLTIAARLLLKHGIRRLPVVEDDKLVGLISVADVVGGIVDLDVTDPISEYLNHGVGPVWYQTPLPVVARHMELAHVKAVPVIDSSLDLVGIISDRDIISSSVIEDSVEMSDMSAGSDDDEWTWESMRDTMSIYYSVSRIKVPEVPVEEIMVKDPITASNNMGVSECALKMKRHRIDQMPVVDANQKFIGLLRDRYLLKALLKY